MGMKTLTILIFSGIILMSCTDFTDQQHYYVDPKFKSFVDEFINEAKNRGINLSGTDLIMIHKQFNDKCGLTVYGLSTVYIDTTSICWGINKKELVFHELGHYFLHRDHNNETFKVGIFDIPKSIMIGNGYIINFDAHYKYYVDELFDPNTKTKY